MRVLKEFLSKTISGGLFILLPILVFVMLLIEIFNLLVALATPIAELFPKGTFDQAQSPVLLALLLLVTASFLVGIALRSSAGRRFWIWVEGNTIGRLPLYNALKSIFNGFTGKEGQASFKPALLESSDGDELVYLVEDHGNGRATIMSPWSPTPFAGSIKIVDRDRVELLDTNLSDFTMVLSHWGVGTRKLIVGGTPRSAIRDK